MKEAKKLKGVLRIADLREVLMFDRGLGLDLYYPFRLGISSLPAALVMIVKWTFGHHSFSLPYLQAAGFTTPAATIPSHKNSQQHISSFLFPKVFKYLEVSPSACSLNNCPSNEASHHGIIIEPHRPVRVPRYHLVSPISTLFRA